MKKPVYLVNEVNEVNSSTTPLNAGQTFTGVASGTLDWSTLTVSCKTGQDGSLFVDFSTDGTNWDSTLTFSVTANLNEVHRIVLSKSYFRIRFTNTSASNQTFFRLQSITGSQNILSSPFNQISQQDADTILVKALSDELLISSGLISGYSIVNKFGRNTDIDTATIPEDVWDGGGVYTGFPTGAPEEITVLSSSASDTGSLTFTYLSSIGSSAYETATVTLNGTTPVNTGVVAHRVHTAQYASGNSTGFNVGNITIRHRTTTANIFAIMAIGRSQTNTSTYTVPAGYTAKIIRLFARVLGSTSSQVDGTLWIRTDGGSPRLRRPFTITNTDSFEETPFGGLTVNEKSDIMVRILNVSANNTDIMAGYDIILIKN